MLESSFSLEMVAAKFLIFAGVAIGILELRVRNPPSSIAEGLSSRRRFKLPFIGIGLTAVGLLLIFLE